MPIYSAICQTCGKEQDIFRTVSARNEALVCPCGGLLLRILTPTMLRPDMQESYVSPSTGRVISSYAQRREDMKSSGYRDWEPGMGKDIARNRQDSFEKSLAPLNKTVDELVTALNSEGKLGG